MKKGKKLYLSIITILMLVLVSCGSRRTSVSEVNNIDKERSLIDVFFQQQNNDKKQYLNSMLKKCKSEVKVDDFEFTLKEAITESNTGYCFYKVSIKSDTVPVGKMTVINEKTEPWFTRLYQLADEKYMIQIVQGGTLIIVLIIVNWI